MIMTPKFKAEKLPRVDRSCNVTEWVTSWGWQLRSTSFLD